MSRKIDPRSQGRAEAVPAGNELVPPSARGARVEEVRDTAGFMALEPEWNALVTESGNTIFCRHEFIRVWLQCFAPRQRRRILTLRDSAGKLEAVLPLVERRSSLYGVAVRELSSAANLHSCRFDLVARDARKAAAAFVPWLLAQRTWDVLRLIDVPEGGKADAMLDEAQALGYPTGRWESHRSTYVSLPETYSELLARLHGKFKANLLRRRRRLEEKGQVTLERVEGGPELPRYLEEALALEMSGWKGRRGTAIAQDGPTREFYSELALTASARGALVLWFLRLDGRAVAMHYALEHAGRYLLLKPAYDEAHGECSPGQLLMNEVLKACIERGLAEFDFLGPEMPWERDWSDQTRSHHWLFLFRADWKGRALREAKFDWLPAAKELVARWKR